MKLNTYESIRTTGIRAIEKSWYDDYSRQGIQHYGVPRGFQVISIDDKDHYIFFDIYRFECLPNSSALRVENNFWIQMYYIPRGRKTEIVINALINGAIIERKVRGSLIEIVIDQKNGGCLSLLKYSERLNVFSLARNTIFNIKLYAQDCLKKINSNYFPAPILE